MRTIKFRAWDEESKMMHPGFTINEITQIRRGDDIGPGALLMNFAWNSLIWEQFTGLHDKNGVEIYEGDVVCVTVEKDDNVFSILGQIVILPSLGVRIKNAHSMDIDGEIYKYAGYVRMAQYRTEVIGNVHQNPELL